MKVIVAQLGARMHYAVPRILAGAGFLERLYTDICAVKGWPLLLKATPPCLRPPALRRLLVRTPCGVPHERIVAFNGLGLKYYYRLSRSRTSAEQRRVHLWAARAFNRLILRNPFGSADAVYAFNSAALELLLGARTRGVLACVEQTIWPYELELALLGEEGRRWPGWAPRGDDDDGACAEFCARERSEWEAADLILCGSEFVRDGVVACGGAKEKCRVVPYGVDCSVLRPTGGGAGGLAADGPQELTARRLGRRKRGEPLRVLTVGAVSLRKGAPYFLEAAKRLQGQAIFRWVGEVQVLPEAARELQSHSELVGPVPRHEVSTHYAWADVMLLPSVCEGSATVTYEALAHGLPVVCTENTGSVVADGVCGFVVPPRDATAVVEKLSLLSEDAQLYEKFCRCAEEARSTISVAAYADRLLRVLGC